MKKPSKKILKSTKPQKYQNLVIKNKMKKQKKKQHLKYLTINIIRKCIKKGARPHKKTCVKSSF